MIYCVEAMDVLIILQEGKMFPQGMPDVKEDNEFVPRRSF